MEVTHDDIDNAVDRIRSEAGFILLFFGFCLAPCLDIEVRKSGESNSIQGGIMGNIEKYDESGNLKIVKVYEDPFTCRVFEGDAWLLRRHDSWDCERSIECWTVEFLNGDIVTRFINKEIH